MELVKNNQLTTLIGQFISERNTDNLFELLNFMGNPDNGELEIPDYLVRKLKKDCTKPIHSNFKSVIPFNTKLWKTIKKLNYQIEWSSFLEETDDSESKPIELTSKAPLPESKLKDVINEYFQILSKDEKIKSDIVEEFSQPLLFFSSINHKLKKISESKFNDLIDLSKELSSILINNISLTDPIEKKSSYLPKMTWEWLFPTLCSAYKSILKKIEINKDINGELLKINENKKASNEIVSLCSIYSLSLIVTGDISDSKYEDKVINNFFDSLSYINKENLCFSMINSSYQEYSEREFKNKHEFHKLINRKFDLITIFFGFFNCIDYLDENCVECLFHSILENKWELEETPVTHTILNAVNYLLRMIVINEFKNSESMVLFKSFEDIFIESINKKSVEKELEHKCTLGPNIDTIVYIIKNYNWELSEDELLHEKEFILNHLIKLLNSYQEKTGFIKRLNFVDDRIYPNEFFIHKHHKYYESISTLSLNLVNDELFKSFENHQGKDLYPTERLVTGAESILKSGYVDLSLVFLGYGLLHTVLDTDLQFLNSWSLDHEINKFSVSQVNNFITKPEVWLRVEKIFLPFLLLVSELDEGNSLQVEIWINAIKKRFQSAEIFLLPTNISEIKKEVITDNIKLPLPIWFNDIENKESITKSIEECTKTFNRLSNPNRSLWNQVYNSNRVSGGMFELSKELEKLIRVQFSEIYNVFSSDSTFKKLLTDFSERSLRDENFLSLSFVEWLLNTFSKKNKNKKLKEFKIIIDHLNSININLGKLVMKISELNDSVINRFRSFRIIRNTLSHGDPLSYSESSTLYGYAICDFDEIYQLNQ